MFFAELVMFSFSESRNQKPTDDAVIIQTVFEG